MLRCCPNDKLVSSRYCSCSIHHLGRLRDIGIVRFVHELRSMDT
jgi:hypothetical protein